jgi:hypothetical protein
MANSHRTVLSVFLCTLLGTIALTVAPERAAAQLGGPGFVFRQPTVSMALHGGYALPSARSDLFDQTFTDLFLDRHDFESPYLGGELSVRVSERWDVALEAGHAWSSTRTEWRDYEEQDGRPIWQTVEFSRTPVTVSGKYYLTDRGRSIGRFVWIPSRVTPFVGAGAGFVRYQFAQDGDFVHYQTLEIFTDRLEQVGTGFLAQGFAGIDISLNNVVYISPQARYAWAQGGLDRSIYQDFEPMDLSGFQFTMGLGLRF